MNPLLILAILFCRSIDDVGATSITEHKPASWTMADMGPASSNGKSGIISPSIPAFTQRLIYSSGPKRLTMEKDTMAAIGISTSCLTRLTISKICSLFRPLAKAAVKELCITAPSAIGSENGIPSSSIPAPQRDISFIKAAVVSRSGKPAVM